MGNHNLVEELKKRSKLAVSLAREIDYKNGKLWDMERKLEDKDRLLQEYISGKGEMQCLKEENKKLKDELDLRSHKEAEGKRKYELQAQSIKAENEKVQHKLEFQHNEFKRRVELQQDLFLEMKRLKHRVQLETDEFESRLQRIEKQEKVIFKEKLERMEYRTHNAEKKSMLLKKQLEEQYSRPNKCLHQKNEVEKRLMETNYLVNKLQKELKDEMETNGSRAKKAEKETILLKEQLEELQRRLNECLNKKKDLEKEFSSFRTENNILVKQLREELRNYDYKLQEARNLKFASRENIKLLKKMEDELSSWKMMIKEIPGISCPDDMFRMFVALQKEVAENMVKSGEANAHLKKMEEQLEELKRRLTECLQQKNDLEKKFSSFKTEKNILVKQLREELRDYEAELQDARKLKTSFHGNLELLKEKLMDEKDHRKRAESELLKLSEIQLRTKKLDDELSSWKNSICAIPGVSCAADVPVKFAALQKDLADAREAIVNLKRMEEQQERIKTGAMMKARAAIADLKQMEVADNAAILDDAIPSTNMVDVPIVEIEDIPLMEMEDLKQEELVADPAPLNAVASTEMVEVPILFVYERRDCGLSKLVGTNWKKS